MKTLSVLAVAFIVPFLSKAQHHRIHRLHRYSWQTRYASDYGIGDGTLGQPVACGGVLTTTQPIVAMRDAPCGARFIVCFAHRCVKAVRLDWGPASWTGRSIDLGPMVARELHFPGLGDVRIRKGTA